MSVTFDRPVNTATVNNSSFRVFGRNSGTASGTFSFWNGDMTVTLTPDAPFAAGEVVTDDVTAAGGQLAATGTVRCDAVEPLPPGLEGFWVVNPADVVHLVTRSED